jgi:C-terminal processing protease CtpA/Prc
MVNTNTFYINIKNFGPNVSTQFVEALKELEDKKHVTKVIIDVRNN